MAIEIKPPNDVPKDTNKPIVFLAGSIEMGTAEDWQHRISSHFSNHDIILLNPRREHWDSSWEQSIDNPLFKQQVDWELDGLEMANLILMFFAANTKSPISLLELGLCANRNNMIVCCPKAFWRSGNVQIICHRFAIPLVETIDDLIIQTEQWVKAQQNPK